MIDNNPGCVVWLTGLSGAGKTTIAIELEEQLKPRALKIERLDGDIVRQSLTSDLGFSKDDRRKNIERVTFVAKVLSRNGVITICSFISPYQSVRDYVRSETTNFLEVYVEASLDTVIGRDVKGMYKKAIAGEIPNFTGISDPFEAPEKPDILVNTETDTVQQSAEIIVRHLEESGLIPRNM